MQQTEPADSDPDIRWVKIEGCDYALDECEILAWIKQLEEPFGHITEKIYPDSDSDGDPTGNGTYEPTARTRNCKRLSIRGTD